MPQEHHPCRLRRTTLLQVLEQRGPDVIGQREQEGALDLASRNAQLAASPPDVIEGEGHHLARAEPVGRDE